MKNNRFITDPKTALEKSIEMWEWLAEHPHKEKLDYFADKNIGEIPWADCYLCEYCNTVQEEHTHCEMCPVDWTGNGNYEARYRCEHSNSPYKAWRDNESGNEVEYAKKVLDLLKNSLKNLDKFEKMCYNNSKDTEEIE